VKEKRRQKIDLGVIIYHALKAQGYMQISLYIYIYIMELEKIMQTYWHICLTNDVGEESYPYNNLSFLSPLKGGRLLGWPSNRHPATSINAGWDVDFSDDMSA
jgi:hypothetical protein